MNIQDLNVVAWYFLKNIPKLKWLVVKSPSKSVKFSTEQKKTSLNETAEWIEIHNNAFQTLVD